ncbi:hypothetical protein C0J52_27103 [Blattella germanica]|nr:hypothetical protein C0J52_27103 [Blattella germanica]
MNLLRPSFMEGYKKELKVSNGLGGVEWGIKVSTSRLIIIEDRSNESNIYKFINGVYNAYKAY